MRLCKMHGLGNDFLILEDLDGSLERHISGKEAARLCARRTGIGADGVILVQHSAVCDIRMIIFNSDGSAAQMCGNGIRCFAKYVYDSGIISHKRFSVETLAGAMHIALSTKDGKADSVTVDMGEAHFERSDIPMIGSGDCLMQSMCVQDREFTYSSVLLGVTHTVVLVGDVCSIDIEKYGPLIENLPIFPCRTNVNFTQVIDKNTLRVRTWERGCGATLACGTGSSSAAVCCAAAGLTSRSVRVELELGTLDIVWAEDNRVSMTGPAEFVFMGELTI
ncbi:MAG: diaminopimelate epimerase [Clostridia bacterium]